MDLRQQDQHADAGEHAVHDSGRDRPEPTADAQGTSRELEDARENEHRPEHAEAVRPHELEHDDGKARGGPAHLQRRAREQAHHDAADDTRDQAALGRYAGRNGDAHAEGQRHEEDHEGGWQILREGGRQQP